MIVVILHNGHRRECGLLPCRPQLCVFARHFFVPHHRMGTKSLFSQH